MGLKVAELETLFTANTDPFEKGAVKVETRRKDLAKQTAEVKLDADAKGALATIDQVQAAGKKLDASKIAPKVGADGTEATSTINDIASRLGKLAGEKIAAKIVPEVDTSEALGRTKELGSKISELGNTSGADLSKGIVGALAAIPFAGAVVGLGAALGKTITSGLQNELRADKLIAQTGLDPVTVGRLGRAAGETYANNWGESIATNFNTAKIAVQTRLLDPQSTERDAQKVITSLSGVSDVLEEDVAAVARSTTQLLRTGLAATAQDAFDIIVKGQQAGLNVSQDWLDTLDEYSTKFRDLGLTGPQAVGLLSQAVKAGARDTDIAADALKEFSIRAVDGSKTTADGFQQIGLSAKDMSERIAQGGPVASAALAETLDHLRAIEDPVKRDAAAVELFGTQAEDMGQALYSMDLSTATTQLGQVAGAAQKAMDALGNNTAGQIESAKRNVEVAADGIKGALAAAFGPQIEGWAKSVQENREAVIGFLLDIANGGLNLGRSLVEGIASGTEAVGRFTAGPLADLVDSVGSLLHSLDKIPGVDTGDASKSMHDLADGMRNADDAANKIADDIRTRLITDGLDPAQKKLNEIGIPLQAQAAAHDAAVAIASDIDALGTAADGSTVSFAGLDLAHLRATESGRLLDDQLTALIAGFDEQTAKALAAGESQDDVKAKYLETRDALVQQVTALGLTKDQADRLITTYGLVPDKVETQIEADNTLAQTAIAQIRAAYDGVPKDLNTNVYANITDAYSKLTTVQAQLRAITGDHTFRVAMGPGGQGGTAAFARGGAVIGQGTALSDSVLARLSNGEHVLTAQEVDLLGGQTGVYRLRALIRSGVLADTLPGFAGGGAVLPAGAVQGDYALATPAEYVPLNLPRRSIADLLGVHA